MTQEEDVVEKIYKMHFPSKEIECQTSLSWVSTMVNLDETLEKIEDNFETYADNDTNVDDKPAEKINNEYAEDVISRTFHYGVIVNETDTSEAIINSHQSRRRGKLKGPKCVRRKNGTLESSDEDGAVDTAGDSDAEENEAINKLKQILEKAEPKSLITRFRCQYCNKSHYDKGVIDLHIIDDHSIPSTSKVNPRYKKSKRQKMQVSIPSNSVQKKYIEDYENYENNYFEDSSECLQTWDENSEDIDNEPKEFLSEDNYDIDNNEIIHDDNNSEEERSLDWIFCDATLPECWKYSTKNGHTTYKSPCGEVLQSREQIVDFMLGKGLEIHHPTGFQGITPESIDCDGLCEGSCDYFKIFRRFFHHNDSNRFRKSTIINFVDDDHSEMISDELITVLPNQSNELKPKTYFPGAIKGERPWIICIKEADTECQSNNVEYKSKSIHEKPSFAKKSQPIKRKRSLSPQQKSLNVAKRITSRKSSSSSRESTPSRKLNSKVEKKEKNVIEYEGIYVQCCKKSCQKWRLVTQYRDAEDVPEYWICSMNRDKSNNVCGVGGNAFNSNSQKVDIKFSCGSLVWAKLKGFPWWPGMIDYCPDSDDYFWVDENISEYEPTWYHVVYFEGKGTEVTRAWIKAENIVSMKTPIKQPHGNTASRPGPLKKRLLNAITMAEEAKKLNRSERLKEFSFDALFNSRKSEKKRIQITPKPSINSMPKLEKSKDRKKLNHVEYKEKNKVSKSTLPVKQKFLSASYLSPIFSDDSDAENSNDSNDDNPQDYDDSRKDVYISKPKVLKDEETFNRAEDHEQNENDEDLLSQIMKKYSNSESSEKKQEHNMNDRCAILDDDFSLSGSDQEVDNNEASLEESVSDVGMVVIKEETVDFEVERNTHKNENGSGLKIDSVTSQCMTEMFIKPEELVSTSNPNLDRTFPKPPLPSDVLIALAVRNLNPINDSGACFSDIVSFLSLQFPYYNRNMEECKNIVRTAQEHESENENDTLKIKSSIIEDLAVKMSNAIHKNKSLIEESMLISGFLESILERFEKGIKCDAVNFRPPYSCKMLSYLAFVTLYPPISLQQVMIFLKFLFPSLLGNKTFEAEDLEEWIKNDEHIQELVTASGQNLYLLNEGVYPTVLHQVRQFFSTKSNFARLNKSIFKIEYVEYLLPNLSEM